MAKGFVLSEVDRATLRQVVEEVRRQQGNPPSPPTNLYDDAQAPEVYIALAPSGGIPARATAECEIYRVILDDDGEFTLEAVDITRDVFNLCFTAVAAGAYALTQRDKFGTWIVSSSCGTTTTTSTTTTGAPCTGTCLFTWNNTTKQWDPTSNTCLAGCVCTLPQFCGGQCGATTDTTVTYCARAVGPNQPLCTTTTAGPTTTTTTTDPTTTTTLAPTCTTCTYKAKFGLWVIVHDGCRSGTDCLCPTATANPADCAEVTYPCQRPTTTTPAPPPMCGSCQWMYDLSQPAWALIRWDCGINGAGDCMCDQPSVAGADCAFATTYCYRPSSVSTSTTTQPTTTTPAPGACNGTCIWRWSTSLGTWVVCWTNCGSLCACVVAPPFNGTTNNQTHETPCNATTTTTAVPTTTSTTSTTTTAAPTSCGTCRWKFSCVNYAWDFVSNFCTGSCGCYRPPPGVEGFCDQYWDVNCIGAPTSTTTTAAPPCGTCTYHWGSASGWYLVDSCDNVTCFCPEVPPGTQCSAFCSITYPCTGSTTTPCPTTTTIAPDGSCSARMCIYNWSGAAWQLDVGTQCPQTCSCAAPVGAGNLACDARRYTPCLQCAGTTTTPAPNCGLCLFEHRTSPVITWVNVYNGCGASCSTCAVHLPAAPGDLLCNRYAWTACTSTAPPTTTTSTTTTTTTAAP